MASSPEGELTRLLELLASVAQDCSRRSESDESAHYALGFVFKLHHHAVSAITLLRDGSALTTEHTRFLDRTSVCVLARAGWECSLLFHHIFIAPSTEDERELRYLRWSIGDAERRQGFEVLLEGQREQLATERVEIAKVRTRIQANAAFQRMQPHEQKRLLKPGDRWRPPWTDIAKNAAIVKLYASDHYSYVCSHAHTGWQSLANLNRPLTSEDIDRLWLTTCHTLGVAAANVISGLGTLFPGCLSCVAPEDTRLVGRWIDIGRTQDVEER